MVHRTIVAAKSPCFMAAEGAQEGQRSTEQKRNNDNNNNNNNNNNYNYHLQKITTARRGVIELETGFCCTHCVHGCFVNKAFATILSYVCNITANCFRHNLRLFCHWYHISKVIVESYILQIPTENTISVRFFNSSTDKHKNAIGAIFHHRSIIWKFGWKKYNLTTNDNICHVQSVIDFIESFLINTMLCIC